MIETGSPRSGPHAPTPPGPGSRTLVLPALLSGVLMAIYLLARPYGDLDPQTEVAALASARWVPAHIAGGLSLATAGWLAARASALSTGWPRFARWAGPVGGALTLLAYGGEASALNTAGILAQQGQSAALAGVEIARSQPAGGAVFGIGLTLLAASGVALGVAVTRAGLGWAGWALGALLVLFVPQFLLPPPGRMGYGLVFALAAAWLARRAAVTSRRDMLPATPPSLAAALQAGA